jgi:hypothetical protein
MSSVARYGADGDRAYRARRKEAKVVAELRERFDPPPREREIFTLMISGRK